MGAIGAWILLSSVSLCSAAVCTTDLTPELLAARETAVVAAAAYNDSFGRHAEERLRLLRLLRGARRRQCALRADAARGVRLQHLCGR